jgi:hypothetical protein
VEKKLGGFEGKQNLTLARQFALCLRRFRAASAG